MSVLLAKNKTINSKISPTNEIYVKMIDDIL